MTCCTQWAKETGQVGRGMNPAKPAQIQADMNGTWNVVGCCQQCYVLSNVRFCPFCGASVMPPQPDEA